jgi:hypothetical protein
MTCTATKFPVWQAGETDWLFLFGHRREKVLSLHLWLRFAALWLAVVLIGFVLAVWSRSISWRYPSDCLCCLANCAEVATLKMVNRLRAVWFFFYTAPYLFGPSVLDQLPSVIPLATKRLVLDLLKNSGSEFQLSNRHNACSINSFRLRPNRYKGVGRV